VGDVSSAIDELKLKNIKIHRDIQDKSSGKNAIILDPDGYMISLFEPNFSAEKTIQSGGYIGFTPA
jgi:lactoylglutathione lyase